MSAPGFVGQNGEIVIQDPTTPPHADIDHECEIEHTPAKVTVDGTRIPVINDGIRTEIRKDGPLSINRHSEVYFPAEWKGENYDEIVRALDPDERNVYDPVDIDIRDAVTGEYHTVHRGFVMGVGGGQRGNLERRMHVGDVSQLLGAIQFQEEYTDTSTLEDVLDDVVEAIENTITPHVFDSVELVGFDGEYKVVKDDDPSGFFVFVAIEEIIDRTGNFLFGRSGKKFEANKHTVRDVFKWLESRLDFWFYFAPHEDDDTIALVVEENPTRREFRATHTDESDFDGDVEDVEVLRNNALHEIKPVNTVTVIGEQYRPDSIADYHEYPIATASHVPLDKRAGMILQPEPIPSETTSEDELAEQAKQELKKILDDSAHGEIVTEPAPKITPFCTLHSKPACGDYIDREFSPLEYEVEEIVHHIAARTSRENERVHETVLRVGIKIDPDDIEVETDSEKGNEVSDSGGLIERLTENMYTPVQPDQI